MFTWINKPDEPKEATFGVKLPGNNVAKVELAKIADQYSKSSKKIDDHLKKAAKDRELANKLAASFIHNYYVMIDISSLLNQYAEFFATIKDTLMKSDTQLDQLNASNFQNLEKLTRQEMDKFTTKFTEQADKVKKLFETYNMNDQAAKLSAVPTLTANVAVAAENAIKATPPKTASFGGSQKYLKEIINEISNGGKQKTKGPKTQKRRVRRSCN